MKHKLLGWIGRRWGTGSGKSATYPQTWGLVVYMPYRWMRRLTQRLCGTWGGHEWSATEWGYGGGGYCDRWCRWCNQISSQPLAENEMAEDRAELLNIFNSGQPPETP